MTHRVDYFVATLPKRYKSKHYDTIQEYPNSIYAMKPFGEKTFKQIIYDEAPNIASERIHGSFASRHQLAEPTLISFDLTTINQAPNEIISKIYQMLVDLCAFRDGSPNSPYDDLYYLIYNKEEIENIDVNQPILELYYLVNVEDEKEQNDLQTKIQEQVLQRCRTSVIERRPIYDDNGLVEEVIERIVNTNNPRRRAAYECVERHRQSIPVDYRYQVIERVQAEFDGKTLDGLVNRSTEPYESFSVNYTEVDRLLEDKQYLIKVEKIQNDIEKDVIRMKGMRETIINLSIDRIKDLFEKDMQDLPGVRNVNVEEMLHEWTKAAIYSSEIFNLAKDENYLTGRLKGQCLVRDKKMNAVKIVDPGSIMFVPGQPNVDYIKEIKPTTGGFMFNPVSLPNIGPSWK